MRLEDELNELLAGLGVVLEDTSSTQSSQPSQASQAERAEASRTESQQPVVEIHDVTDHHASGDEDTQPSELCLFQTSREHYGVFYRLDLVDGAPQLRVFVPDEGSALNAKNAMNAMNAMKMRCYLVRAGQGGPLCAWFDATRGHDGSAEYDDARETAQQHLLFAAGEVMKRLFWAGDLDACQFPAEIGVRRLA